MVQTADAPVAALAAEVNSLRKFTDLVVAWIVAVTLLSLALAVALLAESRPSLAHCTTFCYV